MRGMRVFCVFLLVFFTFSCSSSRHKAPSFAYDLHLSYQGESKDLAVICFHGFGGDYRVLDSVEPFMQGKATLISFNFPDYGKRSGFLDPLQTSFGTIEEILPALYVLKKTAIDDGFKKICLYGFSAGAAAAINCISALNNSAQDAALRSIGINKAEKKKILSALQAGDVILDTPLKSIDELVALYGNTQELEIIGKRFRENQMDPIHSLKFWKGLSLNVLVHFQVPDEVVSNRDDELFVKTLKSHCLGNIDVLVGSDCGHKLPHASLWEYYMKKAAIP
jgi:hypothetical protein